MSNNNLTVADLPAIQRYYQFQEGALENLNGVAPPSFIFVC